MDKVAFLAFTQCQLLLPDIHILILVLAVFASTDLESTQGHSYRIGGTFKHLLDGVPPHIVMKIR